MGRLFRDIKRKITGNRFLQNAFEWIFKIVEKLLIQEKDSKNKVYSLHEPHVECIAKGKAHKKYEFGCKVSFVVTHKEGLALSSLVLHGNPYDGHTLKNSLKHAENNSKENIDIAFVDKGYKGHCIKDKKIFISGQKKGITKWFRKLLKRRQAIEPFIGHMKSDGKLGINYLKGELGDRLNAVLCAIGHNLRMLIRKFRIAASQPV